MQRIDVEAKPGEAVVFIIRPYLTPFAIRLPGVVLRWNTEDNIVRVAPNRELHDKRRRKVEYLELETVLIRPRGVCIRADLLYSLQPFCRPFRWRLRSRRI